MVPRDAVDYPTLGPQVCAFIESNMVHGPGDLRGQRVRLGEDWAALIYRLYEVYPRGHEHAGRRRFKRAGLSLAKGVAKTERAAMIAACELHPDGPVRCVGWTPGGEPIGGPVVDPYIPMIAYTQAQSDELAFAALRVILENSPLRDDLIIDLEKVIRKKGDGKAEALSSNPNSRDGARTTFAVLDETHRWTLPRQRQSHTVMQTNIPKRYLADGWLLEVTTAPEPGAGSVAEATMDYARAVDAGLQVAPSFFFFHRQASDTCDLTTDTGRREAIVEASGEAASWRDIDSIAALWQDPLADVAYLERVYCNRLVKGSTQAFDVELWKSRQRKGYQPKHGALITVGFDGAQFHDGTGLVATEVETGFQWVPGVWECPPGGELRTPPWQVPTAAVDRCVRDLFENYTVYRMYADPPYWQSWVAAWIALFGKDAEGKDYVVEWWTNRRTKMTYALENFDTAIKTGTDIGHDGDVRLVRHLGNARRLDIGQRDEQGRALWLVQKDRPDSVHKIDLAMAAVLSWEARTDAVAEGALERKPPVHYTMLVVGRR